MDLPDYDYIFPSSVAVTSLHPDIMLWCQSSRQIKLLGLTVCFEENFFTSISRKKSKYKELVSLCQSAGWETSLLTLGSRGLIDNLSFDQLLKFIRSEQHEVKQLFKCLCRLSIATLFAIWCKRDASYLNSLLTDVVLVFSFVVCSSSVRQIGSPGARDNQKICMGNQIWMQR